MFFSIRLQHKNNKPIDNLKVKIEQKTHDFKFGCNALNLGQLGKYNEIYEERILNLFNLITTTVCWDSYEPEPGKYNFMEGECESPRRPPLDRVRKFAKDNNIVFKGQPMIADSWVAKWTSKDPEELKKQYIN